MTDRTHLQVLVSVLPETEMDAAARYLEFLIARNVRRSDEMDEEEKRRYIEAVEVGLAQADRGELIEDEVVWQRIEQIVGELPKD